MFSVQLLEDGEYKFKGFCSNKLDDIFVKTAREKLGWDNPNIKLISHNDEVKSDDFMKWLSDENPNHTLIIDSVTNRLEKVTLTSGGYYTMRDVKLTDADASSFYTSEEIASYNHNQTILDAWNVANPDPAQAVDFPDYLGVEWPSERSFKVEVATGYDVVDYINGDIVDIDQRIIDEEVALSEGKIKLDI